MTLEEKLKLWDEYSIECRKRIIKGHYLYPSESWWTFDLETERNAELFDASVYPFIDWARRKVKHGEKRNG